MVAAIVIIGSSISAYQTEPSREPMSDARTIANAISGMVTRGDAGQDISAALKLISRGGLRVQAGPGLLAAETPRRIEAVAPGLRRIAYIVLLDRDGRVVASSDSSGPDFDTPERPMWMSIHQAAMSGSREVGNLVITVSDGDRRDGRPMALGGWVVLDQDDSPVGSVIVGKTAVIVLDRFAWFVRGFAFFTAASVTVLVGAFAFALATSVFLAYSLSRRLVARLERLGSAAEGLSEGDLSRRVDEGPPDEVGHLSRRFNHMAERIAMTVGELESARTQAEAALRSRRELVANVSHELRTPLASIRGHVESLLMRGPGAAGDDEVEREYLGVISRETTHLSSLIDDLFVLSTAEARVLPLVKVPTDVQEVIAEVSQSVGPAARDQARLTVVTDVPADVGSVVADRERLVQVLGNLVRNAIRHTPAGGLISLGAHREIANGDSRVWVTVADTGEGIAPEHLPFVFDRFYRGDSARDRESGGAGLGLAIVRELVEAMDGEVRVESEAGEGSRFSFSLPAARTNGSDRSAE